MAKHTCKIPDPPPDTGRWMGTYGDMVTLLMAFFVMLFAVQDTNQQKFVAFVSGLAGPFDNPAVQLGLVQGPAMEEANVSPISMLAPAPGTDASGTGGINTAAAQQLDGISEELLEVLERSDAPIVVDLRDDQRGLVVSISTDEILFAVGSAELAPEGQQLIAEIAPILRDAPNTIVIEGHTDNTPLERPGYSNWNLSTDRAVAVLELLGEQHGVPYDRISATGFGEHRPLVPNDSEDNRSINRRVEILIVGMDVSRDGSPPPPPTASAPGVASGPGAVAPPAGEEVVDVIPIAPLPPPVDPGITTGLPAGGGTDVASGGSSAGGGGGGGGGGATTGAAGVGPASTNQATMATILGR